MSEITVVIPTLDEELHIERVLESVRGIGPTFVVDSGSSDGTRALAENAGATVVEHGWEGYAAQKNWALDNLPLETEWVLFADADEWVTAELRAELETAVSSAAHSGYWIPRRNVFLGRELKHAWWYPDYQLRLFRRGQGRFEERLVHEHVALEGEAGFLEQPLYHENRKGIEAFVERHVRYAELEAEEMRLAREGRNGRKVLEGRLLGTWPERRRALKTRVWYRLPGRPWIRFFWMYVVKRGFLDGREGRVYSQLIAFQEALIDAKRLEQELGRRP